MPIPHNWKFQLADVDDSMGSLTRLLGFARKAKLDPIVRATAIQMVASCDARDDMCELQALYNSVKYGNANISGFEQGVKYVSDPDSADYFIAPPRLIDLCQQGACAGDCDDSSMLLASLAGALGFVSGLKVYKPVGKEDYEHIYAVAGFPKLRPKKLLGLDATVPYAEVGWEPPRGSGLTVLLDPQEAQDRGSPMQAYAAYATRRYRR